MEQVKRLSDNEIFKISNYLEEKGKIDGLIIRKYLRLHNSNNTTKNFLTYDKIMKCIDLIIKTLKAFGFSEEEAIDFIDNNKFLILEHYSELRMKFAILNSNGLLEEVLLKRTMLLHRLVRSQITAARMYSLICYLISNNIKVTIEEIFERRYTFESYEWLCSHYRFCESEKNRLLEELDMFHSENKTLELK